MFAPKFSSLYAVSIANLLVSCWTSTISHELRNHTVNKFGASGGYIAVHELPGTYHVVPQSYSCFNYVNSIREPDSLAYWRRTTLDELNVSSPLSYWSWDGTFTTDAFNKAAKDVRNTKYKILAGKLYKENTKPMPKGYIPIRPSESEDLLKLAVYLFPLPDMEFLLHYSDSACPGEPVVTYTSYRNRPNAGWTMPSGGVWMHALGPTQMTAYHACLRERYPANQRKPMAVWRGSNTGAVHLADLEHCLKAVRVQLHQLSRQHPDLLDARLNRLHQPCAEFLASVINETSPGMHMEDYNKYCVILDADGNGWSDRFANSLVHFPTVIMKQASNLTAYVEHLYPPGHTIEQFDASLKTVVDTVKQLVADCKRGEHSKGQAMVHRMQTTSRVLLDHVGVARAMAYTLLSYKQASAFKPSTSLAGFERVTSPCCRQTSLPPEVGERINRWLES